MTTVADEDTRPGPEQTRERSRALFAELAAMAPEDPTRGGVREALVELHLPLVDYCVRRFTRHGREQEEVTQAATLGLIHAVDRFDPERGVEFTTFATPTIVGEIKRHLRDAGWAVRVPRRLQELRLAVTRATADLTGELGRSPRPREVAERVGTTEEAVLEAMEAAHGREAESLDAPLPGTEEPLVEQLGQADTRLARVEVRESLGQAMRELPPREQQVLVLRFVQGRSQGEIAGQVGLSQAQVSRVLTRSLARLREYLDPEPGSGG